MQDQPLNPPDIAMEISEESLHALVDGRLAPAEAARLEARIAEDPHWTATLQAWRAQRQALRRLHADMQDAPVPASFVQAAQELSERQAQRDQWWRWGGMAASVALAFVLGWGGHGLWQAQHDLPLASANPVRSFVQQAVAAHAVYLPEVRHPVEVPAAQQEHLVQWLSKRVGRPLKVPVLLNQGYELVGGRLLPGDNGARAQFMFQNAAGERVTLYIGAIKPGGTDATSAKETAFRFTDDGAIPGFYWVDQGFGYALTGKLPRPALLVLATAVYPQL